MSQPAEQFDRKSFLRNLTTRPGVYRMLDAGGEPLYIGKARNLKNRLSSYFRGRPASAKLQSLLAQTAAVDVSVTGTETEALLLEYNLIKEHKPRYNVVLRDDKSYPYVRVSTRHDFPRLAFYRGSRKESGRYFGPYPSAYAVRETLNLLQKLFQLRQCDDNFFRNRSRPCLQYQIKRCSAPCVGLIDAEGYAEDVRHAELFLQGKDKEVLDELVRRMESAAEALDYERAAQYRDQIRTIRKVSERQFVAGTQRGDFDAIGVAVEGNRHCVAVLYIRGGRNLGHKLFFPRAPAGAESVELLRAFLSQYYMSHEPPLEILVAEAIEDAELLGEIFTERRGRQVRIRHRLRGTRARWLAMAATDARHALRLKLASNAGVARQREALREGLALDDVPARMECFDISHTRGEEAVASCVVFGQDGPLSSDYRRFNIRGITPGDDYAAMEQALRRRYTRIKRGEAPVPDILFVDGGKGQVAAAAEVLRELQLEGVEIVGIAKGPGRRPGAEQLFLLGHKRPLILPHDSTALHLIQRIRDEAHRFAIAGHRLRRAKARKTSVLEAIPGLGPKRRRELLRRFGGLQGVQRAGIDDLARVRGIGRRLAESIYARLHSEE